MAHRIVDVQANPAKPFPFTRMRVGDTAVCMHPDAAFHALVHAARKGWVLNVIYRRDCAHITRLPKV